MHGRSSHGSSSHGSSRHGSSSPGRSSHGRNSHVSSCHGSSRHGSSRHGRGCLGSTSHGSSRHGSSSHGRCSLGVAAMGAATRGIGTWWNSETMQDFTIPFVISIPKYQFIEYKYRATVFIHICRTIDLSIIEPDKAGIYRCIDIAPSTNYKLSVWILGKSTKYL